MKPLLFYCALLFVFCSCQKCYECTNEKLFDTQEDEIEFEYEICEDDFGSKEDLEHFIDMLEEEEGVRCYKNLW